MSGKLVCSPTLNILLICVYWLSFAHTVIKSTAKGSMLALASIPAVWIVGITCSAASTGLSFLDPTMSPHLKDQVGDSHGYHMLTMLVSHVHNVGYTCQLCWSHIYTIWVSHRNRVGVACTHCSYHMQTMLVLHVHNVHITCKPCWCHLYTM